jgi:dephospho-CoA kinase
MVIIGLTGSIGMGKSATANIFRRRGVPVHDSDAAVHELYNGPGNSLVEAVFPGVVEGGKVNRAKLGQRVIGDSDALRKLEAIIHPLVADDRTRFIVNAREANRRLVVLDVPLLFEIGGLSEVDAIVVVSAPAHVQAKRVLSRPGVTREKFEGILARQVPDTVKRTKAHFVIDTSRGFEAAERQVDAFLRSASGVCRA